MSNPTIDCKQIITDYLKSNGFDGLCGDGCGCGLDNLCPCVENDGNPLLCKPAYAVKGSCPTCENREECEAYVEGGRDEPCYMLSKDAR